MLSVILHVCCYSNHFLFTTKNVPKFQWECGKMPKGVRCSQPKSKVEKALFLSPYCSILLLYTVHGGNSLAKLASKSMNGRSIVVAINKFRHVYFNINLYFSVGSCDRMHNCTCRIVRLYTGSSKK